jgi:hypothetical protein
MSSPFLKHIRFDGESLIACDKNAPRERRAHSLSDAPRRPLVEKKP